MHYQEEENEKKSINVLKKGKEEVNGKVVQTMRIALSRSTRR